MAVFAVGWFMFKISLVLFIARPDRLLIEPTGLAALSTLDTLDKREYVNLWIYSPSYVLWIQPVLPSH